MITIYEHEGLKVSLDDDGVIFTVEGIQRLEMTETEFADIVSAYKGRLIRKVYTTKNGQEFMLSEINQDHMVLTHGAGTEYETSYRWKFDGTAIDLADEDGGYDLV